MVRITQKEILSPFSFFAVNRSRVQEQLTSSAFRRGASAFRLGLVPRGISDHLPIQAHIQYSEHTALTCMSWNLLADEHLYNNFLNISGGTALAKAIKQAYPEGNIYYNDQGNKLFYFFSELAQYLYKKRVHYDIQITQALLIDFIELTQQSSNLARSRNPVEAKKKSEQVESARAAIIAMIIQEIFSDEKESSDAHEFKLAMRHSLELIYHIQNEQGALKWSNRYELIKQNKKLTEKMIGNDFLCLQECSNPEDISDLFEAQGKSYHMLSYGVGKDYCILVYDKNKFNLLAETHYALEGKKPCIFAKFQNRITGEVLIMASLHHPGGQHSHIESILQQVDALRKLPEEKSIPFYLFGDYNHTQNFFEAVGGGLSDGCCMIYPADPTMAGSDYGNTNKAIDAVITNQREEQVTIKSVSELSSVQPASFPLVVEFNLPKKDKKYFNYFMP